MFRPTSNWKASTDDKGDEDKKKLELKNAKIKCRICSGDHFTTKCPFRDTMAPEGADAPADMPDDAPGGSGGLGAGSGGYVPPHLRGKMGGGEKMGGKFDRDDSATLRVTNVSEIAEEQDLRDMFSRFGHVTRVFLAKDRETGRAKGFAFISYADRSDAAKACEKMDGCKFPVAGFFLYRMLTAVQTVSDILFSASSSPRRLKRVDSLVRRLQLYLKGFWDRVAHKMVKEMVCQRGMRWSGQQGSMWSPGSMSHCEHWCVPWCLFRVGDEDTIREQCNSHDPNTKTSRSPHLVLRLMFTEFHVPWQNSFHPTVDARQHYSMTNARTCLFWEVCCSRHLSSPHAAVRDPRGFSYPAFRTVLMRPL